VVLPLARDRPTPTREQGKNDDAPERDGVRRVATSRDDEDDREESGKLDKAHLLGQVAATLAERDGYELRDDAKREDTGKDRTYDKPYLAFVVCVVANRAGSKQDELNEGNANEDADDIHDE